MDNIKLIVLTTNNRIIDGFKVIIEEEFKDLKSNILNSENNILDALKTQIDPSKDSTAIKKKIKQSYYQTIEKIYRDYLKEISLNIYSIIDYNKKIDTKEKFDKYDLQFKKLSSIKNKEIKLDSDVLIDKLSNIITESTYDFNDEEHFKIIKNIIAEEVRTTNIMLINKLKKIPKILLEIATKEKEISLDIIKKLNIDTTNEDIETYYKDIKIININDYKI